MRMRMLSILAGFMLAGCLGSGSLTVSGSSDPYWDGHDYVTVTNHTHCENCGHYYYDGGWNLYPANHVYDKPGYGRRNHGHSHDHDHDHD